MNFEKNTGQDLLGWNIDQIEAQIGKILSSTENHQIVHLQNGKLVYMLRRIPSLSRDECKLLGEVTESYRTGTSKTPLQALEKYCDKNFLELDQMQIKYLSRILDNSCSESGIISELIIDPDLEEIAVIGIGKSKPVYVFNRELGWIATNIYFSNPDEVKNIVNAMAVKIGRRVSLQKPALNAFLSDGSRINACIEPAAVSGPTLTIRKFRQEPISPAQLAKGNFAGAEQLAFIWMAMQSDCSILVCGNTGSGKTTLLNSIFSFIPASERIVIVEETPEILVPHNHCIKLAVVEGIELGMKDLIVNTLRMRPDRVVVGEVRNKEEVGAFMDTLLAGQGKGSYATFHAQSAKDAIKRLRSFGVSDSEIESLDLIITQKRWSVFSNGAQREERKMIEISQTARNGNECTANVLFSFDFASEKFLQTGKNSKIEEKIMRSLCLDKKGMIEELERRKKFIESIGGEKYAEFFNAAENYWKKNEKN